MGKTYTKFSSYECSDLVSEDEDEEFFDCANIPPDEMDAETYTVDALDVISHQNDSTPDGRITLKKVELLEDNLEFYEKVSLVYLLYENADVALQYLLQLQQGVNMKVLVEWARATKHSNWRTKLLEALSIIKNFQVIEQLGFDQTEVNERFLYKNKDTSLCVDLLRKKLYLILDAFTNAQLLDFISIIRNDFNHKHMLDFKEFHQVYIEMYLLHWATLKYITPDNLDNLCKAFKVMELFDTADNLKLSKNQSAIPNVKQIASSTRLMKNIDSSPIVNVAEMEGARSCIDNVKGESDFSYNLERSVSSESSAATIVRGTSGEYDNTSYRINPECPGVCLIINQEYFYNEPEQSLRHLLPPTKKQLERRIGTLFDKDQFEATYRRYGYQVKVRENRIHSEIIDDVTEVLNSVGEHSSLVICILSHGIEGKVYGSNSIPVDINHIKNLMCHTNVPKLNGKPKILILQACRGNKCQQVVDVDDNDLRIDGLDGVLPRTADLLVFSATVSGYGAVRDPKRGSWFIQTLCDTIKKKSNKLHFEEICTLVRNSVIKKRWETDEEVRAMVPIIETTLSNFFFLPQIHSTEQ